MGEELLSLPLPDGRVAIILPLTYGRARLHPAQSVDDPVFFDGW